MSRRRRRMPIFLLLITLVFTGQQAALPRIASAATALVGSPVNLSTPDLVRSTGPELAWSRYTDTATFDRYEVHRSRTSGFTPPTSTLLTAIKDQDVTRWADRTAAASVTFYYKVFVGGTVSPQLSVATPATGTARLTVDAQATYVTTDRTTPVGCVNSTNNGTGAAQDWLGSKLGLD
jgi:hypothetical protein